MAGTVLFGDDGSASADLAWMWINQQDWRDWSIDVLTAYPEVVATGASPEPWTPDHPRVLLDPSTATAVQHLRVAADPRVAILNCSDRDLIVVGPRGQGLLKALHLGSTVEWLIHNPPAPLVIARRGTQVRRALVCTDGSPDALAAARAFGAMPWAVDVDVTVLAVEQVGFDAKDQADAAAGLLHGKAKSVRGLVLGPNDTEVFYHVRDIILSTVRTTDVDLLVQGTTGQSRWASMRAGSIATSLAAHAPCSVFMVHDHGSWQA